VVRAALVTVLALAAIIGIGGACTLLDDDPPDESCRDSSDCFRAQGEVCNPTTKRCEMKVYMDAGIDAP
jgi:hypothetical protein